MLAASGLALILIPFLLFGSELEQHAQAFISGDPPWWTAAAVLGGLLALDVLLPVPSSFVSTSSGALLGFAGGALVSWSGMTIGCAFAYWLGARAGRAGASRLVSRADLERAECEAQRVGPTTLVVLRAVPVMAEASVIFAGVVRMPFAQFSLLVGLSNLGISLTYAGIGAYAADVDAFFAAFAGALIVPALAMGAFRLLRGARANE